jgi:hypothetical protein
MCGARHHTLSCLGSTGLGEPFLAKRSTLPDELGDIVGLNTAAYLVQPRAIAVADAQIVANFLVRLHCLFVGCVDVVAAETKGPALVLSIRNGSTEEKDWQELHGGWNES